MLSIAFVISCACNLDICSTVYVIPTGHPAALRALVMVSQLIAGGICTQRARKPDSCGRYKTTAVANSQAMISALAARFRRSGSMLTLG